jgi:hypothetical protein
MAGGRSGSSWWREVSRIRDGVDEVVGRGWFAEGVERRVGSGVETFFWSDPWLGGVPLRERYPRLFDFVSSQVEYGSGDECFRVGVWRWSVAPPTMGMEGRAFRGV